MKNGQLYSTLIDASGKVISCNNSLRKELGLIPGQLIGKSIFEVLKAFELEKLSQAIDTCLADPELTITISVKYKSRPQKHSAFQWTVSGEADEHGTRFVHLTGRPQSNPKEATPEEETLCDKALFKSRKLFEELVKHSPLVGWLTDEAGVMQYMNPAYLQTYRLGEKDFGKSIFDLFPKDIASEYFQNNRTVISTGKAMEIFERGSLTGNREQVLKIYKFPLVVGTKTMVAGWAVDVTEQVEIQDELRKNVERYSFVKKATSDAIYDWDMQTKIIYRGVGFQTLFGYAHLRGSVRFNFHLIHPQDLQNVITQVFSSLRAESTDRWRIEYRFRDAAGKYKHVIDKAFIIRQRGKALRVIGAIQDVSEQRSLQERLINQERASKRALVRSIITAQEKERRQLSVELHDNVNQILSSCKLLLDVAQANTEMVPSLLEKGRHNLQLAINEIRRISHNLNPAALQDIGLVDAVNQLVDDINAAQTLRICFVHDGLHDKNALKEEDRIAVFRIIQEKLNNMLKHARAKNARIKLSLKKDTLLLIMEDDGVGFDLAKAKKGIGLRNIQNRVESYRGKMHVKTAPGKGCRMQIALQLPRREEENASPQKPLSNTAR